MSKQNDTTKNMVLAALMRALAYILPNFSGNIPHFGSMLLPMHLPVLLCGFLCGGPWGAAVGFIAADAMRDEVERQDVQLKKDVSAMRALQSKVNGIVGLCGADIRPEVTKLAEELRYSDPVSSEALAEIEAELTAYTDELQAAVVDGDSASARELCRKISVTLLERNRLCKLNK